MIYDSLQISYACAQREVAHFVNRHRRPVPSLAGTYEGHSALAIIPRSVYTGLPFCQAFTDSEAGRVYARSSLRA